MTGRAPETARAAARAVRDAFGGEPRVFQYLDDPEEHEVGILIAEERPGPGFTSFSTVTLHLYENRMDDRDIRVELAAVVEAWAEAMAKVLATAALKRDQGRLAGRARCRVPGPAQRVRPVSESERRFLVSEGYFELERRFEAAQVEYWNLNREPLV